MPFSRFCFALILLFSLSHAQPSRAQLGKGNQILLNRGLQVQAMCVNYDNFHLNTYSNANYTSINWLWDSDMAQHGAAPGFPWSRWVRNQGEMPPLTGEASFTNQLVSLQLGDEAFLNDDAIRTGVVNWFNAVRTNWPNTILYVNNYGGQVGDTPLDDFITRAQPDMLCFDTYPWRSAYDANQPDHIGAVIDGPPTSWYSQLRRYREHARGANIPLATYRQTFHAVEEYGSFNVYRNPSPSELRLNTFAALAFNAKTLIDFLYNNGSSSLFIPPGGDSNPNALYFEMQDANRRARNFGKALVRLKPVEDAGQPFYTTGILFIRGKNPGGTVNPIPISFLADPEDPNSYTDWADQRNDPYLTNNWVITNTGTKNNGQPGDVIVSWFKPLDESFDGADYTNEIYMMVVNGLSDPTGTAADCSQEIKLNFASTLLAVEMLNPLTGLVEVQALPLTNGLRQLVLNLNGGDAVLFKFSDGAAFVGAQVIGPPVIARLPASRTNLVGTFATFSVTAAGALPLSYQWRLDGVNINGATTNSYTQTNVQSGDNLKSYTVVVNNAEGSVTSAPPAILSVISNLPPFFYEPFNYLNIGSPVSSNTPVNWTFGGNPPDDLNVTSGGLSYSGLNASIGNSVTNGGVGLGVRRLFGTNINSGTFYFSALFRINNLGFGTWTTSLAGAQVGALTATNNTSFPLAIMVKSNSPTGYVLGVQKAGGTAVFDATDRHTNDTVFLVGQYDFRTSPNIASLWINPNSSTFGTGSAPMNGYLSATTGTDGLTIDRFNMRQNTAASVPAAMQWDELRVGNSWAAVTPLPTTFITSLTDFVQVSDGKFQFTYTNSSGQNGTIYSSTNLIDWNSVGAATLISPGLYQFTDAAASNYPHRFYQLRSP